MIRTRIVTHVLTGQAEPMAAKSGWSGINKQPRLDDVAVGVLGLEGDTICDTKNHGGTQQAVYVLGEGDYAYWNQQLRRVLPPGTLGENLIISQLDTHQVCIGDQFAIGELVLAVTAPRIPCVTLAVRMNDRQFPRRFLRSGYTGFYCAVLTPAKIGFGMPVDWRQAVGNRRVVADLQGWETQLA